MNTSKLREAIARELYHRLNDRLTAICSRGAKDWVQISPTSRLRWLNADDTNALLALFRPIQEERDRLRECLSDLCGEAWICGGGDIDGGAFQDLLEHHGVIARVPADKAFREEWDSDEMYVEAWKADEVRERVKREAEDENP